MWELTKIVIPRIKAEWKNVAYSMRIDLHIINSIERESHNLEECCQKLFINWLTTNNGPTPKTWKTLLERVEDVDNLVAEVEHIKKEIVEGTYGVIRN